MRYGGGGHNPFDAIVDFARRHDGPQRGGGGRDRDVKHEMFVSNDQVGAVIGRKGSKINEIRNLSGASINVLEATKTRDRRDAGGDQDRERIIEIHGSPEQVAIAKSLINVAVELADGGGGMDRRDYRRYDRERSRSRSRDRGGRYDDRRRW